MKPALVPSSRFTPNRRPLLSAFASHASRLLALGLVLLALAGCGKEWNWNQKLIVTVETPDGMRTGEAVVKVERYHEKLLPLPEASASHSWIGEATVVELGDGRYLFALLGVEDGRTLAAFGDVPPGKNEVEEWNSVIETLRERRPLPREAWPRFVTFDDVTDPTTVRQVNPENLEPRFGPGHRIASVELELTGEPITRGKVEALLPWLGPYPEPPLVKEEDPFGPKHFGSSINHGRFILRERDLKNENHPLRHPRASVAAQRPGQTRGSIP